MTELQPAQGWQASTQPRLSAPPPARRSLLFRSVSKLSARLGRSEVPDIIAVLHLNPRLFWAWLFFASRLMPFGRLPAQQRELLILRTAWNCRSRYEWGQHLEIGLREGLSDEDIVQISQGPQSCHDTLTANLLKACDELCQDHCIAAPTWQQLEQHFNASQMIEIMLLIGHYIMIAGFLNSSGLQLEAALEKELNDFHRRISAAK